MASYNFITIWKVNAPLEKVWNTIENVRTWTKWWKGVLQVKEVKKGVYDHTWQSVIPYKLTFRTIVTEVIEHKSIEAKVSGELAGRGKWVFKKYNEEITLVTYYWKVRTTSKWMNLTAPFLSNVFKWNHHKIMSWGAKGIAKKLKCKVKFKHN